jgi:Tfp pilus assembly protein PilX
MAKASKTMGSEAMGNDTMGSDGMKSARLHTKGFTLIASLLMLLLLSGIAIGLMMMVNTEGKVGATDLQSNVAFHSAEGGIEKMASDLSATFQNAQSPTAAQICNVSTMQPTMVGVTWKDYSVAPASGCSGTLKANWGQISSGPNQGLWAQIIPVTMLATAALTGGQEVSMTRSAQVALIPVFQFGVFSESDLSFFSGPNFDMAGPVHTNGDLYPFVGSGSTLTFHNQVSAYGNVVRTQLVNGFTTTSSYNGTVYIPTAANGCSPTTSSCTTMVAPATSSPYGDGSVQGAGGNPPQSTYNTSVWNTFSKTTTNREILNGNYGSTTNPGTGAKNLSMPFVNGTKFPYEIIRRPPAGESATSILGESREYSMAQIRVLLSDDPAELPGGASDTNNVRLANVTGSTPSNPYGIPTSTPAGTNTYFPVALPALGSGSTYNMYFAAASNAIPDETNCNGTYCPTANTKSTIANDWLYGPATPPSGAQTLTPTGAPIISGAASNAPATISLCPPPTVAAANLPTGCSNSTATYPYYVSTPTTSWNLIDGYLRVEYKDASGNWHPVTNEWLQLGFARGVTPPTQSGGGTPASGTPTPTPNPINPNAILLLQQPADRRGDGTTDPNGLAPSCTTTVSGVCTQWKNPLPPEVVIDTASTSPYFGVTSSATATQSISMYNWYPINFYDAREGEVRDTTVSNDSCTTNGVMNAVEIDVGNLKRWLAGAIGTSGTSVDYVVQNGYVLYFSDRRGMLINPTKGYKTGDSGLEDVINASVAAGTPNGTLEPIPAGKSLSPEDVNQNGLLDEYGTANLGLGQYNGTTNINASIVAATPDNPYSPRITSCSTTARKNWVSGARHVLRLVDGSLGNLPLIPGGTLAAPGGFTVASENPVYILGNYNTNSTDTVWNTTPTDVSGHAAASVVADAVTLLSNSWLDRLSMLTNVTTPSNRTATTTYYRVAIAGGKNINFPQPTWSGVGQDFGTDGGVHNFLRYLEDWGSATLNYKGSIVSLYYATYNTGIYKCCTDVYSPPTRNYSFDLDFSSPTGLPPGTPMFRDVESLGYRQLFTARTN